MKKALPLVTILLCCAVSVSAQERVQPEEYEIYKFLLGEKTQSVVFRFTTDENLDSVFNSRKRKLSVVQGETRRDYNQRNRQSFDLENNFGIDSAIKLVGDDDIKPFFDLSFKDRLVAENTFYEKFGSRSLVYFSRVGFNRSKTQALLSYISNDGICGTCASNYIYVLSKKKDGWRIKNKVMGWIS